MASQLSMDHIAEWDDIVECVLDGLEKSHNEYFEWSYGEYIWNAPEYLLTVNIAKELIQSEKVDYLTLEDNVKKTMEIANATGAGRTHKDLRKDGRFDIVLWGGDKEPKPPMAVVEVKNKVYAFGRIKEDIERIKQTLLRKQEDSTIEFGLMAFYATNTYKKESDNNFNVLIEGLLNSAKECLEEHFSVKKYERTLQENDKIIDGNVYRPVVFKIQKI